MILNCIRRWPLQTAGGVGVNDLCCKSSQKGLAFSLEEVLTFEEDKTKNRVGWRIVWFDFLCFVSCIKAR